MVLSSNMITRVGILIAVTVALGWMTLPIPNVELVTASVFLAGYWCGPLWGVVVGILGEGLFSLSNPYGIPLPQLLIAQCIGMALAGFTGGWLASRWKHKLPPKHIVILGTIGLVITLMFDILTTLSFPLTLGVSLADIWKVLIMGIPFTAVHAVSNVAVFAIVVRLILSRLPRLTPARSIIIAIALLAVANQSLRAQNITDLQPPALPDSQKVEIIDSLEVDSLALDTLTALIEYLPDLPPMEQLLAPGPGEDPMNLDNHIDRVQFLEPGIEDIGDVLRYLPGTYPYDMATFGAYAGIWMRGQTPRKTTYSLDGRVLNHRRNGMADLNEITVEEIEKVFTEPGVPDPHPPSTGGDIGFRSYLPMRDVPFSRVALRAGYYGFTTVDFHIAQRFYGNWSANLVGQIGYFEDKGDSTDVESAHFRAHLTHKPTPLWSGRISYYHYRAKNQIPYPSGHHKSVRNDLILSVARRLKPAGQTRLEFQSWITDIHQNDLDVFHESEARLGGQLRAVAPVCSTGSAWVGLFAEGWEIEAENDPSEQDVEIRAFGGATVPITSGLTASSSVLYAVYDSGIDEPAASTAITLYPLSWIKLTGSGEWSFRAPSYFESFGHGRLSLRDDLVEPALRLALGDTLIPPSELCPERSQTFSGEVTLSLPWSFRLSFGAFRIELSDPIVYRQIEYGHIQAQNGATTAWQGSHVACQWTVWDSLELTGTWNFNDAIDDPDAIVPQHSGWTALTYRRTFFQGDLRMIGRIEGKYWGERTLTRSLRTYTAPEAKVFNFRISATIKDVTLFWGMNNMASERYQLLGGYPMIHREDIFGVRWNFLD
jgi:uncharacterized membrane protein